MTGKTIRLLAQLNGRLSSCVWDIHRQQVRLRIQKEVAELWNELLLNAGGEQVSFPNAGSRREGLSREVGPVLSDAPVSKLSWPRRLRQRVFNIPIGFTRKILHTTDYMDFLMWVLMTGLVLAAPFTKVEESFGMQAVHDVLYHRFNLGMYDHHEYPGVVARSFIGPGVLALCSAPIVFLLRLSKPLAQIAIRIVLGTILVLCFKLFRLELTRKFGQTFSTAFGIVCCTQFHLLFYISRTLPNVFALALVLLALKFWLEERFTRMFAMFCATIVIFRAEVVLLLAPVALDTLVSRRVRFFWMIWCGVVFGIMSLLITVSVDSIFWRKFLWPEGSGLLFNVVNNQSHLYGVSAWHWYVSSALPRAMLGSFLLFFVGLLVQPRVRRFIVPAVVFVALYSFLPHKELRFIFYALPLLNLAAAAAIESAWKNRSRIWPVLLVVGVLCASLAASGVMAYASIHNYPGGHGIRKLHELRGGGKGLEGAAVWLDNLSCQTGVTRFLQERPDWMYDKRPEHDNNSASLSNFYFVLSERSSIEGFREIGHVDAFSHMRLWPPAVFLKTAIRVFENENPE